MTIKIPCSLDKAQILSLVLAALSLVSAACIFVPWDHITTHGFERWKYVSLFKWVFVVYAAGFSVACLAAYKEKLSHINYIYMVLIGGLFLHSGCIAVLGYKYLSGIIPSTWTEEIIYLTAIYSEHLSEIYAPSVITEPPFLSPIYGPGFYFLIHVFFKVAGETIFAIRLLTALSVAGIVFFLYKMPVYEGAGNNAYKKLIAPGLLISSLTVMTWSGPPSKPEYVAMLFIIAGLYVFLSKCLENNGKWIVFSAILFAIGLLVKITLIGTFSAVLLWLLIQRRLTGLVMFFGVASGVFLLSYGVLYITSDGGVAQFTIQANAAKLLLLKIVEVGILDYLTKPFTVLATGSALALLLNTDNRTNGSHIVAFAVFASFGIGFVVLGRPGSSFNYFLEAVVLGSIAIALAINRLTISGSMRTEATVKYVVLIMVLAFLPHQYALLARSYGEDEELSFIRNYLDNIKTDDSEYIYSDAYYSYDVYAAGHRPVIYDNTMYALMIDNGHITSDDLLSVMKSGKVPYLVLQNTLEWHSTLGYGQKGIPADVLDFMKRNYVCNKELERKHDMSWMVVCRKT